MAKLATSFPAASSRRFSLSVVGTVYFTFTPVSVAITAAASVSVTVAPAMEGAPLRLTSASLPMSGVFFTSNAELARFAAAARSSSNAITSVVPSTVAPVACGAVVSGGGVTAVDGQLFAAVRRHTRPVPPSGSVSG